MKLYQRRVHTLYLYFLYISLIKLPREITQYKDEFLNIDDDSGHTMPDSCLCFKRV